MIHVCAHYIRCQMLLKIVMKASEEKDKQVSLVSDTRSRRTRSGPSV